MGTKRMHVSSRRKGLAFKGQNRSSSEGLESCALGVDGKRQNQYSHQYGPRNHSMQTVDFILNTADIK